MSVDAFEMVLLDWLTDSGLELGETLSLDGKTLRGIHGAGVPGVHLVSAYATRSVLPGACYPERATRSVLPGAGRCCVRWHRQGRARSWRRPERCWVRSLWMAGQWWRTPC